MSFSISLSEIANHRYTVTCRVQVGSQLAGIPAQPSFSVYCETWQDVKDRLRFNISDEARFVRKPSEWYSEACKVSCKTYRRPFHVAVEQLNDGYYAVWYVVAV